MNRLTAVAGACLLAFAALGAAPAVAQDQPVTPVIVLAKDKSAAFRLEYPASEIVVAQPETVTLRAWLPLRSSTARAIGAAGNAESR